MTSAGSIQAANASHRTAYHEWMAAYEVTVLSMSGITVTVVRCLRLFYTDDAMNTIRY